MLETIENYILAWNAPDEKTRLQKLNLSFHLEGRYIDPHIQSPITNLNEMNALIRNFREKFEHKLILVDQVEIHHSVFRFSWKLEKNGSVLSRGMFCGEMNETKHIQLIFGFIDSSNV